MSRLLKRDIPGPDWRIEFAALRENGIGALFAPDLPSPLPLEVEIGFGRGEFLLNRAELHPKTAFVGVEISHKRVLKMARRLARSELRNVRLLEAHAEQLVCEGLSLGSVASFWINFPDPWPKKRHHRRRLLQPAFVRELCLRLEMGGCVEVATDHAAYAEAIECALSQEPGLVNDYAPEPYVREVPGRMPTAYELEWRKEGRPLHFFRYRRMKLSNEEPLVAA